MNLGQGLIQSLEQIEFEVTVPATPALVDAKTITFTVQDSADGTTFAVIDPAISTVITGVATSQGGPATAKRFRLPSQTRQYVRLKIDVLTAGGDSTAVSATLNAFF